MGVFGVPGPRDFALRVEPRPHDRVERVVVHLTVLGLLDPLTQGCIGGQASRLLQGVGERGQASRREKQGLARGPLERPQGLPATGFVAGKPMANGMALDAQQRGPLLARLGWPARQPIEQLAARSLATMMFPWSPRLEGFDLFSHDWACCVHHRLSSKAHERSSQESRSMHNFQPKII